MKELEVKIVAFAFIISFDFLNGNEKLEQYSKEIISLKDIRWILTIMKIKK